MGLLFYAYIEPYIFFYFTGTFSGMIIPTPTQEVGCRVAPYVNMPSMRLAFDRLHMQHLTSPFDPTHAAAHHPVSAAAAAAAAAAATAPMLFYHPPPYAMNFAALDSSFTSNKNSSIADLRLKAKKHAAALGL